MPQLTQPFSLIANAVRGHEMRIGSDTPGTQALRTGRVSLPGWTYMLTFCTYERRPVLTSGAVPDAVAAVLAEIGARDDTDIDAFVIMPDNLHLLCKIRGEQELSAAVRRIKSLLARAINAARDTSGSVWQRGYYDRAVRCVREYGELARYIWENPVRAGLVKRPEEYPWSSQNVKGVAGKPAPTSD